jgi:hypothetical protein
VGQHDRSDAATPDDRDGATGTGLGPPGWAEYAGARARFMRTLEIASLEAAWAAPALEPARGEDQGRP